MILFIGEIGLFLEFDLTIITRDTELTFETAIEISLLEDGGYVKGHFIDFDADLGIFPKYVIEFLKSSQPIQWEKLANMHKDVLKRKNK